MKNKSARHKSTNVFKFVKFADRINNIDVDIFHKVGHRYETEEDEDAEKCIFAATVEKWSTLNLTDSFNQFKSDVQVHQIITLPQLLHNKDNIVSVLIKHLRLKNPLSLQPLLDLVVALANDLRADFYKHFYQFLEVLIELLTVKDTDVLEWLFHCLAYLFKYLWKPIVNDIVNIFNALFPLLSLEYPSYVNNFAAESFAFVSRKVKNFKPYFFLIVKSVKKHKDGSSGCGKLLFEIVKGVSGLFHSCSTSILPIFLESFWDPDAPQDVLFDVMQELFNNITSSVSPNSLPFVWSVISNNLEKCNQQKIAENERNSTALNYIILLLQQFIDHKNGANAIDSKILTKQILNIIKLEKLPEEVKLNITKLSITLLLSKFVKIQQEDSCFLTNQLMSLLDADLLLYFMGNTFSCNLFESLILPKLLKLCVDSNLDDTCLNLLTKTVLFKAPLTYTQETPHWKPYLLNFGSNNEQIMAILSENIQIQDNFSVNRYLCSLIIVPHLKNNKCINETLMKNILTFCEDLKNVSDKTRETLFLLLNSIECILHMDDTTESLRNNFDAILKSILPLCKNPNYVSGLKTLNLCLSHLISSTEIVNLNTLMMLHEELCTNFNSPYRQLRLITSRIYSLFEATVQVSSENNEEFKVFSVCNQVESTLSQVETYRNQLLLLDKFNPDKVQMEMCKRTHFTTIPLRYLCGALYINFKLLWDPLVEIIGNLGNEMETSIFWTVFLELLKESKTAETNHTSLDKTIAGNWTLDFFNDLFSSASLLNDKPDFPNQRAHLWKAMLRFSHVAESKNRDLVDLFLNFVNEEYLSYNTDMSTAFNIKQKSEEIADTIEDDHSEESPLPVFKLNLRTKVRLLVQQLQLFSKFHNPKSLYKEPEMRNMYYEFLAHRNKEVQKVALDCLMTYKYNFLQPYSANLYNIIDERNLKHELTVFKLNEDSSVIEPTHRQDLLPVILKIIYGKMTMRLGGSAGGQQRRNLILRFIAGCTVDEILIYLKMAFRIFDPYLMDNHLSLVNGVIGNLDLEKFVPPKRLQSMLNLIAIAFEHFGNLMKPSVLSYLLKILLCIGAFLKGALLKSSEVHVGYQAILKTLRTSSVQLLGLFFNRFIYPWSAVEINAVFDMFIWPNLGKFEIEGIHSPTALLKLFGYWANNPKYFPLLVKFKDDELNNPLQKVINLLQSPKSHKSVMNFVMEMVNNLLKLTVDMGEEIVMVDSILNIDATSLKQYKSNIVVNYGSKILLPHLHDILRVIKQSSLKKKRGLSGRELDILLRMSDLVWDSELCDSVLELILNLLKLKVQKSMPREEDVQSFLVIINNLLKNVSNPQKHLKQIAPLFGFVKYTTCRKQLCEILDTIAKISPEVKLIQDILTELNSYDSKWIDQPNYDRRLRAFERVEELLKQDEIDLDMTLMLIYHCFYSLRHENDLSMKNSSSHYIKLISSSFINKAKGADLNFILEDTLLPLIKSGFKNSMRSECISLLGHLARESFEHHVILKDLHRFSNKDDLETDFFENLVHLQLHRQGRAILKIKEVLDNEKRLNVRTLTQFLIPIITHYLSNDDFIKKYSLIDNVCDAFESIAKSLPWHYYELLLKNYLQKLMRDFEYQKQTIKIVVHIIDAYHFDLSKAETVAAMEIDNEEKMLPEAEAETLKEKEDDNENKDDEVELSTDDEGDDFEKEVEEESNAMEIPDEVTEEKSNCYLVLNKSAALRVIRIFKTVLIPQLNRVLAVRKSDHIHKATGKRHTAEETEEEDLLRIPIVLAVVKLFQQMPKEILDSNLPGLIMKLCTFLKSKLESVRRMARQTMQKIMLTLGPDYLGVFLREISGLPFKGYQMHVLVFTVHAVLSTLKPTYQPGHLDNVLITILDMCKLDIFGILSEEKEIKKIGSKTVEATAASNKSFDTLQILAEHITEKCLLDLLAPIKEVLFTHSFKMVKKAEECLKFISLGLVANKFINTEGLVKFSILLINTELNASTEKAKIKDPGTKNKKLTTTTDSYIIPKPPTRRTANKVPTVAINMHVNSHVIIEFALKVLHLLLRRDLLNEEEHKPLMDPSVDILMSCLSMPHVKVNTNSVQCLEWILKNELPSTTKNIEQIVKSLFGILHKYASSGLRKGDNFDLVVATFKTMATILRDVKYYVISNDQLRILLTYIEQDLHNYERQATAFGLLKAIINRKLVAPELYEIMRKVAELSITSEMPHIRQQSRIVFHHYLMDYPLKKKLETLVGFYLTNLDYELQSGRESAFEMLQTLIATFPLKILQEFSALFFLSIGIKLSNDDVASCRKMAGKCIIELLKRLNKADRDPLFEMILLWFKDKKITHRKLAAQLCGLIIVVEEGLFEPRIESLMPLILSQFGISDGNDEPGKFVKAPKEDEGFNKERVNDHHLYQLLQTMLKLCTYCPGFLKRTKDISELASRIQGLLAYPHEWVRLGAAQFLGFVLATIDIRKLASLIENNNEESVEYPYADASVTVKSLGLDLFAQLKVDSIKAEMAEQVIKNLLILARVLQFVSIDTKEKKLNLLWFVNRMKKQINMEIIENSKCFVVRTELFKLIGAMFTILDMKNIQPVLQQLMQPLLREIITKEKDCEAIINLAKEVTTIVKSKVPRDQYESLVATVEKDLFVRRAERKRQKVQLAVTDPELHAKKKIRLNKKKQEHKKAKILKFKSK